MTREESKKFKELRNAVEKVHLKPLSRSHGFKMISGFPYKVIDGMLYELRVSAINKDCSTDRKSEEILVIISVKPIALDEIFWEVFEMKEDAAKQPFSFHIMGAFTPYALRLDETRYTVISADTVGELLEMIFTEIDKRILAYSETIKTVADFGKMQSEHQPTDKLNCILCDILTGNYDKALKETEKELAAGNSGGFADLKSGRDIYDYIKAYCSDKLKEEG